MLIKKKTVKTTTKSIYNVVCEKQIIRKKNVYNNKNSVYYENRETMINYFHNYIICTAPKVDELYLRNKT